jgi:tetratricopeptide (TPR) repeat protein
MGKSSRRKLHPSTENGIESDPPKRTRRRSSGFSTSWVPYALVLATGAVLYANSFSIPFLFDDHFEIVNNEEIRELDSPAAYLTRPRGVNDLTLALNYRWGGLEVWGYHFVNVAIHVVNGWLVYALALAILRLPLFAGRYRRHDRDLATLIALIFIAHPLQTMAASYLVQRAESLSAMFYLGSVLLFTHASTVETGTKRTLLYVAILAATFLGILSKETAATVPFVLLLHHFCFGSRPQSTIAKRVVAALLFLAPILYALYLARYQLLPDAGSDGTAPRAWFFIPSAGFNVEGVTPWTYLLTQFGVVLWYLRLYFLPTQQCFDYGWPFADTIWRADVLGPLIVLLSIAVVGVLSYRRYRLATFCIGWFFLCLGPTSSIIPLRDAAFEHRMYLPIFGLTLLVVVAAYDGGRWLTATWPARKHVAAGLATIAALWIAILGGLTVARNHVYQDPMRLAADSISTSPENWRAHYEYGDELARRGRTEEAVGALQESIRLAPTKGTARIRLGGIYVHQRRLDEAEEVLTPATEVIEESVAAAAHRQLGYVHLLKGERYNAEYEFQQASKLMPQWASVHLQLGRMYAEQGLWYGAAGQLNDAIRLDPKLAARVGQQAADVNYRAGVAFFEQKKMKAAAIMFRHAVRHRPDFSAARHYLAVSYAAREQWDRAREELEELSRLSPNDSLLAENLKRAEEKRPLLKPTW